MLKGMISYAHEDADLCAELKGWLVGFEREGRATFWSDHAIDAGEQWHAAILDAMNAADVVLLLLSQPFFASRFIHNDELPLIKARREAGALTVIPIRLRQHYNTASETYAWLRDEQQVPRDSRVIYCKTQRTKRDRDDAWHEVIGELGRSLTRIAEQRSAGIANRSAVDSEIAELRAGALADAQRIVRQVPENLDGIARSAVEAALAQAATSLDADPLAFADQVASAVNRLRRCRISSTEHAGLSAALDVLRSRLGDLFETAREAGFPASAAVGVPRERTVPQAQIAEVRSVVEARLGDLEAKVNALAAQREGTPEAAATDAAITEVVDDVKGQAAVARDLLAEPLVDVAGVSAAVEGAARAAGRFVRRVAGAASVAFRTAAEGIEAATTVMVRAGAAFAAAARGAAPVECLNAQGDMTAVPGPPDVMPLVPVEVGEWPDRPVANRAKVEFVLKLPPIKNWLGASRKPRKSIGYIAGDIREIRGIDVWVNPLAGDMLLDKFTDRTISAAVRASGAAKYPSGHLRSDIIGDELRKAMGGRVDVRASEVVGTSAGELFRTNGVRMILHVAIVELRLDQRARADLPTIGRSIDNIFQYLAHNTNYKSVAIPIIGTGDGGLLVSEVAPILVDKSIAHLKANPWGRLDQIFLVPYNDVAVDEVDRAFDERRGLLSWAPGTPD
jgi:O-acetyl-ADP-ribose deacetylase (regulator of RNase III)